MGFSQAQGQGEIWIKRLLWDLALTSHHCSVREEGAECQGCLYWGRRLRPKERKQVAQRHTAPVDGRSSTTRISRELAPCTHLRPWAFGGELPVSSGWALGKGWCSLGWAPPGPRPGVGREKPAWVTLLNPLARALGKAWLVPGGSR